MILLSEICCFFAIYLLCHRYLHVIIEVKLCVIIILCVSLHYLIGYLLLLSSKIHEFMKSNEEESIEGYFLLSYFITSIYSVFSLMFPSRLKIFFIPGVLGVTICYILNLKILIQIMKNPRYIKLSKNDKESFSKLVVAALVIIFMIIVNLYLGVCLGKAYDPNAFSNNPSNFDLFYFTITTFTTIGFGDIVPISIYAKAITILIAISSVIVITIFLGSIFSFKQGE